MTKDEWSSFRPLLFVIRHSSFVITALCVLAAPPHGRAQSPRVVDEARARAAGIRKLSGEHLTLYTNVRSTPAIDELPAVFDLAVPQWAAYFGIDPEKTRNWRAQGFLIQKDHREPFESLGLMPTGHESFPNGISVGREFWLYAQPSDYYTRHLLLHEGTHVFMLSFLGACGPGWYMEGTAELFGTHEYDARYKQLTLRAMPPDRESVAMWGRIKLIRLFATHDAMPLAAVLKLDNSRQMHDDLYAWCWAAAKFLDAHPRYRGRFRKLKNHVTKHDFNDRFRQAYRGDWAEMQAEWQAFIAALDYGYDFDRNAIAFRRGKPLVEPVTVTIAADRGWQSSGVRLSAGKTYRITAAGRYEIANDGQPWPCEPGGVTIDYHADRPLGMLLGAVDGRTSGATLADSIDIGLGTTIKPAASGTLYLRVNDASSKLDDNRGTLRVTISLAG
jgi:hypothetical protein